MKKKAIDPKTESKKANHSTVFYSARGVLVLVAALLLFAVLALFGMYALGVIRMPASLSALFGGENGTADPMPSADISPAPEETTLVEAIAREEYAAALSDMKIPSDYYRAYTVSIYAGNAVSATDYYAVVRGGDWWVQTAQDGVTLSTAVCKDGKVKITDNTENLTVSASAYSAEKPSGIRLEERMGVLPIGRITAMIGALGDGGSVDYGGGITTYSLALKPARGAGENVFTFECTLANGVREVYNFSFESAVLLSVEKYRGETLIYKMENTAYANDLSGIDADKLFE